MAYDEGLAQRVEDVLRDRSHTDAKTMFGGVGYLLDGNMACGVHGDRLIVRVGTDAYAAALSQPHTREFDLTGRPMKGWITVGPEGTASDEHLADWIEQGLAFARTLPPKVGR
jgi:TfoX/Sxy family transcriptional regulator of competence genes